MILSQKYGVNPTMPVCFFCQRETGEVALLGRILDKETRQEVEAPRHTVLDHKPCDECKKWMEQGVILISIRPGEEGSKNPFRTGGWCVVKDDAISSSFSPPALVVEILKRRCAFIPDDAWDTIGLPREPAETPDDA